MQWGFPDIRQIEQYVSCNPTRSLDPILLDVIKDRTKTQDIVVP
jgi:hypothetical protein